MSANKLDQTTYNDVAANTVFDGVLDAPKILTWRQNVQSVVNQHADQINAIVATGGTPLELNQQSIINGNMEVNQRVGPYTIATAASAYTVDRMRSLNTGSGANATVSQVAVTDLDASNFGLHIVHATAPTVQGKLMQSYTLEARDSYKMAGQTRTISVKVKGVVGMNQVQLFARYRTTEGAISETSTLIGQSALVTINTGAWTDVTLTVTLPNRATLTANGCIGYLIVFSKTSAESSGDGAIVAQWHDNTGSDAKPFQPRSFAEELALCQRYYEKSYDYGTPPGTSSTSSGIVQKMMPSNTVAIGQEYGDVSFKVAKRIPNCSVTVYPWTTPANTGRVSSASGVDLAASSGFVSGFGTNGFRTSNNSGAAQTTAGNVIIFHYAADAEL